MKLIADVLLGINQIIKKTLFFKIMGFTTLIILMIQT